MREDANEVSSDRTAVLPSSFSRQLACIFVELGTSNVWMFMKVPFAVCKRLFNITAQLAPYRVLTYSICSAKIRLPLFKDRTKVEKDEVVICDGQVGRVLIVGC